MTKTGRSAAAGRADEVISRRAAAFREREAALRRVLADYFAARERADRVRAEGEAAAQRVQRDADARIAAVRERGEREAAGFEDAARVAVARIGVRTVFAAPLAYEVAAMRFSQARRVSVGDW